MTQDRDALIARVEARANATAAHGIKNWCELSVADVRDLIALATLPAPADWPSEELVRAAARAIALVHGEDPDEEAPLGKICGPRNEPLPMWRAYEEEAQAALRTLTPPPANVSGLVEAKDD